MKIRCPECGKWFEPRRREQHYCSQACGRQASGRAAGHRTGPLNGRRNLALIPREVLAANGRRTAAKLPREHYQRMGRAGGRTGGLLMRGERNGQWSGRRLGPKWDKYRAQERCRRRTKYAVRIGQLERQPCKVCGSKRVEAHHSDYSKPLRVIWYCQRHHQAWHRRFKAKEAVS